tara:strand:+ start:105 stop:752 length:648 start_codon:yes stop_codon:yes gene_type:complete
MTPSLWEAYNFLLLSPDSERIRKLLTHYEIFKKAMLVPGDIVECGVFKGAGFMYWLKLLDLYAKGEYRKVIGFDTFSEFSNSLLDYEKVNAKRQCDASQFEGIDPKEILSRAKSAELKNCELVKGDVIETIPKYVKENTGFRISLLHLDLDAYLGTKTALENLYDLVTPGGIILLDEYGIRGWGESDAVDEFIKDKDITIHSIQGSYQPTAYIVK